MSNGFREKLLLQRDAIECLALVTEAQLKRKQAILARRSHGITKVHVAHKEQPLYVWDVYIYSRKDGYEPFKLPGQFPLKRIYGNVYHAHFHVPIGAPLEVIVHWNGGHVMISAPGRPWNIACQVGRCKDGEENITTGFNVDGKGTHKEPYTLAQLPAT